MKFSRIIFIIIFASELSNQAYACRCEDETTIKEGLAWSTAVLKGKVLSRRISDNLGQYGAKLTGDPKSPMRIVLKNSMAIYKVEVTKVYKGKVSSAVITIITALSTAGCGYQFEVGGDYIIYASDSDYRGSATLTYKSANERTYWTNICTRTQEFDHSEEREIVRALKG